MLLRRTIADHVLRVQREWGKMVFLSGPRQVGKTTLAQSLESQRRGGTIYFNWDVLTDRKRLARDPYFFEAFSREPGTTTLLIFDEIHKYSRWKSYLKGVYDGFGKHYEILVTGSGRLDLYRKGGDSLLGRYVSLPLFPLTVGEVLGRLPRWPEFLSSMSMPPEDARAREIFEGLLEFTGFPEPYVRSNPEFYRTWSSARSQLLVREDIRDATNIRNISQLEMLVHLLGPRVGSPLSVNSLREDLDVAFETVRDWLDVLSNFYYFFWVPPYSRNLNRALRKERKMYLYDWGDVSNPGARFENLVAMHLYKAVQTWTALGDVRAELFYIRDKEKREVDFVMTANGKPAVLLECKAGDIRIAPELLHFQEKLNVPLAIQLVAEKGHNKEWKRNGRTQKLLSADRWLAVLP